MQLIRLRQPTLHDKSSSPSQTDREPRPKAQCLQILRIRAEISLSGVHRQIATRWRMGTL
jgi:hypothetical protein